MVVYTQLFLQCRCVVLESALEVLLPPRGLGLGCGEQVRQVVLRTALARRRRGAVAGGAEIRRAVGEEPVIDGRQLVRC